MKKFINKYWFIIAIVLIGIIRFFFSCNLPSFYITNLKFDDKLMINYMINIYKGDYLGIYNMYTLIKGIIFPLLLVFVRFSKISYSYLFTIINILSILYFTLSCKKITNNKIILLIIYIVLLFNPLTYSSELFQRLYLNVLSISELLIFLGLYINLIYSEKLNKKTIINYVLIGLVSGIMLLTRNDTIWVYILLFILFIVKIYKNIKVKNILINIVPFIGIMLVLCVMSFINYKYYGVFTYNELEHSSFKDAYNNILKISNGSEENVSIGKNTLFELSEKSSYFDLDKDYIEDNYNHASEVDLDDGNIIWFFRNLVYNYKKFNNGKEASEYFNNLNSDINKLFKEGKLEKKNSIPVIYVTSLKLDDIKKIPSSLLEAIIYTCTYQNVKTYTKDMIANDIRFMDSINYSAYAIKYVNYRYAENIIKDNSYPYEIFRIIYKYLTIVLSIVSLIVYIINIKKKDNINNILHIIVLLYLIILGGVVYTHVSAFHAIRYRYLADVYILQELFILFNIIRFIDNKYYLKIKQIIKK